VHGLQVIARIAAGLPEPQPSAAVFVGGLPTAEDEKRLRRCAVMVLLLLLLLQIAIGLQVYVHRGERWQHSKDETKQAGLCVRHHCSRTRLRVMWQKASLLMLLN
jgi:hypothetical protein